MHRAITAALTRGRSVLARAGRSCVSAGVVGLVLAGGSYLHHVNVTTIALLLVLAVLCIALVWGWLEALVAAVVAGLGLNYFFLPPRGSFSMDNPQHWVDLLAFLVTALATGQLSARERRQRAEAVQRRRETEKLHWISRALWECHSVEAIVQRLPGSLLDITGVEAAAVYHQAGNRTWRAGGRDDCIAERQLRATAASGKCFQDPDSALTIVPLREGGQLAGSIGVAGAGVSLSSLQAIREIVENAVAKAQVAESAKEAEIARRAEELRSAVFDALAHEATGPLGTIQLAATSLLSDRPGDAAQQREMITIVKEEVDRLHAWITETVRMFRADGSPFALHRTPHDVKELVASALETLGPRAGGRPIRVELPPAPPKAHCDADLIRRVLHLLLDNAVKYSPAGSPIAITSNLDGDTGMVVVSVADAGPGVPPEEQARIFEKHYRGARHNSSIPGMGLGLASARYLVASHGGRIWVTNRPEGGAVFHFSLPSGDGVAA